MGTSLVWDQCNDQREHAQTNPNPYKGSKHGYHAFSSSPRLARCPLPFTTISPSGALAAQSALVALLLPHFAFICSAITRVPAVLILINVRHHVFCRQL